MRRKKGNPKIRNLVLLLACVALFLILAAFLIMNHRQEAKTSKELNQMATEQLQSEKSENEESWTKEQSQPEAQSQRKTRARQKTKVRQTRKTHRNHHSSNSWYHGSWNWWNLV